MSVPLKVYFTLPSGKQEIRRFTSGEGAVLPALQSFLSSVYEKHFSPHPLRFVLQFDDGEDLCSISTEAELQDALKLHAESAAAGSAMKILAAFDTAPPQQQTLPSVPLSESATATPASSPAPPAVVAEPASAPASAPASPSEEEGVLVESDNEYERIEDEASAAAAAAASFAPLSEESSGKASLPAVSAPVQEDAESPAAVRVAEPEEAAAAAGAAAAGEVSSPAVCVSAPSAVDVDGAPSVSPEVSIEDVSFSSVPEAAEEAAAAAATPTSTSTSTASATIAEEGPSLHSGVTCDGCGVGPIVGVRYNCVTCGPARGGFDLCQSCEERGGAVEHDAKHEFAVHVKPIERVTAQQQQQQHQSMPAQSPVELVQAAVQRVVENLSGGHLAGGAQALQGAVGDVISAIQQAGQQHRQQRRECRRNWWEARQEAAAAAAAAAAEEQKKASESAAGSSSSSAAASGPAVHAGITCDGCGATPICGVRYHCQTCDGVVRGGFDLCDSCESAGDKHDASHLMLKMRVPQQQQQQQQQQQAQQAQQGHCGRGGRGGFGGGRGGHHGHHGWGRHGHGGWHGHQEGPAGAGMMPELGPLGPLGALLGAFGGGGHHHGHGGGGGFWGGRGGGWGGRGGRGGCHRGGPRDDSVERPRAEFVSDVTLADGLQVHAGETLRKVWSVKNVGSAPWPVGTRLIFVGGDLAPESDGRWGCDAQGALVPFAAPGDIVHVEVDIVVPAEAGRFRATFRLQTAEGVRFGPRVWIDLNVPEHKQAGAEEQAAKPEAAKASAEPVKAEAPAYAAAAFASAAAAAAPAPAPVKLAAPAPKVAAPLPIASQVAVPVKAQAVPVAAAASAPAGAAAVAADAALAAEFKAAHISPPAAAASSAAAAPSADASSAGRVPFVYANELGYLRSMGFVDNALNKYLLLNNKGSLQAVVQWLLANAKSA